jgi:hypothetical protein
VALMERHAADLSAQRPAASTDRQATKQALVQQQQSSSGGSGGISNYNNNSNSSGASRSSSSDCKTRQQQQQAMNEHKSPSESLGTLQRQRAAAAAVDASKEEAHSAGHSLDRSVVGAGAGGASTASLWSSVANWWRQTTHAPGEAVADWTCPGFDHYLHQKEWRSRNCLQKQLVVVANELASWLPCW